MKIKQETIRVLRLEQSLTQEALAVASGMNLRTVQRIEKDGVASMQSVAAIAEALNVEATALTDVSAHEGDTEAYAPHKLILALKIIAGILLLWGVAQLVLHSLNFDPKIGNLVTFVFFYAIAMTLLTSITDIQKKRTFVLVGCALLATLLGPPNIFVVLGLTIGLWLIIELPVFLLKGQIQ